jgi:FMN phosphatase YigB (HAD superfamily)
MPGAFHPLKSVVFDYGNTLIPFSVPEILTFGRLWGEQLGKMFGPPLKPPAVTLHAWRPTGDLDGGPPEYRSITPPELCAALVEQLYDGQVGRSDLNTMLRTRYEAYLAVVKAPPYVREVLEALHPRYHLALFSSEPDDFAVRSSLDRLGLDPYFCSIATATEVGHVLPHLAGVEMIMKELPSHPGETLFVGSRGVDLRAAREAGLHTVHLRQWPDPDTGTQPAGVEAADEVIDHLCDLLDLL